LAYQYSTNSEACRFTNNDLYLPTHPRLTSYHGQGLSKIFSQIQQAIIKAKRENSRRSIDQIIELLTTTGMAASDEVSRSSIHRLIKRHGISRMTGSSSMPEEFRSFETQYAGQIWYGDVMHGPSLGMAGNDLSPARS